MPAQQAAPLPDGWAAREPGPRDVEPLLALLRRHERHTRGWPGADRESVAAQVNVAEAHTHTHLVLTDPEGMVRGWIRAHDRAAGRVLVDVTIDPALEESVADPVAGFAFARVEDFGVQLSTGRGVARTQLDSTAFERDDRQHGWLRRAGYECVRTWWQMSRPVAAKDGDSLPPPREGVVVRRVRRNAAGMPEESDLRDVHLVLEQSFGDHFNSHHESFEDFVARLREDPGHRWDHWWLAEVDGHTAGAVVASAVTGRVDDDGKPVPDASYIDYIGVHSRARGRGVAKGLLHAVIADAAARGRERVGLEVDADSPTGAERMYGSMGWRTTYHTQSWHRTVRTPAG